MAAQVEVPIDDESVAELRDWASLWGDLLHVEMVLEARSGFADEAKNLFIRRGLWESAVISYGRTAMSGRREQQIKGLLAEFGQEVQEFHDELMRWRNHHVAHRVDDAREQTEARAIIDTAGEQIKAIRVTVSPTLGPEDEGEEVASRFMGHVKVLRDLVWTQRLASTEAKAIAVISGRVQELSRVTVHSRSIEDRKFSIDLDPRGGNS